MTRDDEKLLYGHSEEYLGEDAGDVVAKGRGKPGNGGEVRLAVAGQGDEGDVLAAGALDVAAADDALGIGEQDNLQERRGRISGCTRYVVAEAGIEAREIKLVVDQVDSWHA